ncbi:CYTH and CHAD domain-containing protein [Sphingomonas sp. SRS2]|uniref:CYTH and CHAD domain-containing protein n=1 Tax=Sphingomonas sp. SRS2 TaxID=133190 RepID=UPI000618463B|nr:CYTH and CHAD domain-containing protein [Sphingomonas sp. SRS2]KKC27846.1 CHAD domain-containing protein [Sphingomonas sp. SRS2]
MTDPVEIELKLEYDPADRDRLLASPLLGSQSGRQRRLVATYFDTPDQQLAKAGYSLRIRRTDDERIQTVKAAGSRAAGLFVRGEWEQPVSGDWPVLTDSTGPLRQFVDARDLKRIAALFVTDIDRIDGMIERPGATLIEYAIDQGQARADDHSAPISEIEFELKQGTPQALFDLARQLNEEIPVRLGVRTKSARGYALVAGKLAAPAKADPVRLDSDGTAGTAFAAIVDSCLRQYRINEAVLLDNGAVEAVHQARVALRRLRTALFLFKPLFAGDRQAGLFNAECRWLAGELGGIRDIDVLVPKLEGAARTALGAIRDTNFAHVRSLLESSRVRLLPIEIAEWIALGHWQTAPEDAALRDKDIRSFADDRLDSLRKRIKREGHGLSSLDDERRHSVRKDAKKLRYAAEFFVSLYPGRKPRRRLDRFLDRLEALQDKLGELNDMAAAPELLRRLGLDADLPMRRKKSRARLLDRAEDCFEPLIDSKRFWRG